MLAESTNLLFLFKSMIPRITAKSSRTWHSTVMQVAHPLQLHQPQIFWEGFLQSTSVPMGLWAILPENERAWLLCTAMWKEPSLHYSHMLKTAGSEALHWTCWCETWMQMLKTHSMKLSMPMSWANLKDQVWVPVAINCTLFPIA